MSSVLKATIKNKTTSVTTHFESASSSSKAETLTIWCKNFRLFGMWQLLCTITETINTLFPVVNFLKCVVTEVVLFSIVAFKTFDISQSSVATHLRCGGIFIANFSWFWQWYNFENRLIFGKVKAYTKIVPIYWANLYYSSSEISFYNVSQQLRRQKYFIISVLFHRPHTNPLTFWLTLFQISSKSVHFRWSYSRTRQHRSLPRRVFSSFALSEASLQANNKFVDNKSHGNS